MKQQHSTRRTTSLRREFDEWAPCYEADVRRVGYMGHTKVIEKIAARVGNNPPIKPQIVDLGTGTGLVIQSLRDAMPDAQFSAVDFSHRMLNQCKAKHPDIRICRWDLQKDIWPITPESADIVTSSGLLDFIRNPGLFLNNTASIMKPGAVAALTYEVKTTMLGKSAFYSYPDHCPQLPETMTKLAENAGLTVLEQEIFSGYMRQGSAVTYGVMALAKPSP